MAPEQLGLLPSRLRMGVEYTTAVDMWALGFIVHELLTGQTPFLETPVDSLSSGYPTVDTGAASIDMRLMLQFCDGNSDLPRELLRDSDPAAVSFIATLVVPDPRARASAAQAMLHPWIIGRDSPLLPEPLLAPEIPMYYNGGYVLPMYNPLAEELSVGVLQAPQAYPVGRLVNPPGAPPEQSPPVMVNYSPMDIKRIVAPSVRSKAYPVSRLGNPPGAPTEQGPVLKVNYSPMEFELSVAPSAKPWSYPAGVGFAAQAGASQPHPDGL